MHRFRFLFLCSLTGLCSLIAAPQPLSRQQTIHFYQQVEPRELQGLTLRSDGRVLPGPILRELAGDPIAELWWDWEADAPGTGWIGSGPDGQVLQLDYDVEAGVYESRVWADTEANHIFSLCRLPDGRLLGGGNPKAALLLWDSEGKLVREIQLAADSVLDITLTDQGKTAWVATGSPALLYRIDLAQFAVAEEELSLAEQGVELVGSVRDRNLRSLAVDPLGRVLAGSSPSGNLYRFDSESSEPIVLYDHDSGEITDIAVTPAGDVLLTIVDAPKTARRRAIKSSEVKTAKPNGNGNSGNKTDEKKKGPSLMEAPPIEKFGGRSELILIPRGDGLPEKLSSRNKLAFYRIAPFHGGYLLPGGDDGELAGYDPETRRSLTFNASPSAQLNDIATLEDGPEQFLLMGNNPSSLSVLDFHATGTRRLQTKAISLSSPARLGALRFERLRHLAPQDLTVELRTNRGRDAVEGWSPWTRAEFADGGWQASNLVGRTVQVAISLPEELPDEANISHAVLHYLPLNRKPVLQAFQFAPPNYALHPRSNGQGPSSLSLEESLEQPKNNSDHDRVHQTLLNSPLVPQPGSQVVYWKVTDPDGDHTTATFSLRHEDEEEWLDLAKGNTAGWTQFDRRTLAEGIYFTRLIVRETSPRPVPEQREISYDTDRLVIDHTPPEILHTEVIRLDESWEITVDATDARSLLQSLRFVFNNGHVLETAQPVDGILDSLKERFVVTVPTNEVNSATLVEIQAKDQFDNRAVKRVGLGTP